MAAAKTKDLCSLNLGIGARCLAFQRRRQSKPSTWKIGTCQQSTRKPITSDVALHHACVLYHPHICCSQFCSTCVRRLLSTDPAWLAGRKGPNRRKWPVRATKPAAGPAGFSCVQTEDKKKKNSQPQKGNRKEEREEGREVGEESSV